MTSIPATTPAATAAPARRMPRTVAYTLGNIGVVFRKTSFLVFTIAMPVAFYVLFNEMYGSQNAGATTYSSVIMVQMAAYGGLGAAISAGTQLQTERSSGWLRQLQLTGLDTRSFVTAKVTTAMLVVLPALLAVYLAGAAVGHVRLSTADWLSSALLVWASMLPMVAWGVVLALALKPEAVPPASTVSMLLLALLGGLWFPVESMPHVLQQVAPWMPSYWILQLGRWPISGGAFPVRGALVLLAWLAGLGALGGALLGRAVRTSRR